MEKKEFTPAEMEVIRFYTKDVVITSGERDDTNPDW